MKAENLTPAMMQYLEIKSGCPDAFLFFRMGDFYEMFFEDANVASGILDIALTSRDKEGKIPMCGVPYHSVGSYISKLVSVGYKVAICEQTENPNEAKGIVKRAVTRIITPGTALEDELLEAKANNYIMAVSVPENFLQNENLPRGENPSKVGFAYMDVSTGEFKMGERESAKTLVEEIKKIKPSEVVLKEGEDCAKWARDNQSPFIKNITYLPPYDFQYKAALARLLEHFNVPTLDHFGCGGLREGIKAAGALLHYVMDTQKAAAGHIKACLPHYPDDHLIMDHSTIRNLELLQNARTLGKKGSLLELLDRCSTAMGGRKIRRWLVYPLVSAEKIKKRLDAVEELVEKKFERKELEEELKGIYDLERLSGKISMGMAGPRDLLALSISLKKAMRLKELLNGFYSKLDVSVCPHAETLLLSEIMDEIDCPMEVIALIDRAINAVAPATMREGGFIKEGYSSELDELRQTSCGGKDWLSRLETAERKRTGINTLKVAYNRVFGYYIEVTNPNLKNIPSDYTRKQTLVNSERFITPDLKEWEVKILTSEERAKQLELRIFSEVIKDISVHIKAVQSSAEAISTLDCIISFAAVADEMNYARPEINDEDALIIEDGRHPVVEKNSMMADGEAFVPNPTCLDSTDNQIMILTGPNMAGKSTYIRQTALIVIMAQCGSFVPAKSATIGIIDRIFSRIGASDDISSGQSTFMVEMNETANILNNATSKSLIILDEIGRGTSTFDGLSIAWAVVEHIHDSIGDCPGFTDGGAPMRSMGRRSRRIGTVPERRLGGAKTLFATHYHELTELSLTKKKVKNYNMIVREWNDKIIFLRKLVGGGASRSYGIHVAKIAGVHPSIIERAGEILKNLESGEFTERGTPRIADSKTIRQRRTPDADDNSSEANIPGLFGRPMLRPPLTVGFPKDPIREELENLDIDAITPVEALVILNKLKGKTQT